MTKSLPPKSLVLYADDDPDDIELVKDAFRQYSRHVHLLTFCNGMELLSYVEQLQPFEPLPCLVILDINMPLLGGKETLSKLRRLDSFTEVPIVLFSTSTLPSEAAFARSLEAGFVTKPLHTQQIHQLVDKMIEHCTEEVKHAFRKKKGR
jgi:CheY-like chemotaxis protein